MSTQEPDTTPDKPKVSPIMAEVMTALAVPRDEDDPPEKKTRTRRKQGAPEDEIRAKLLGSIRRRPKAWYDGIKVRDALFMLKHLLPKAQGMPTPPDEGETKYTLEFEVNPSTEGGGPPVGAPIAAAESGAKPDIADIVYHTSHIPHLAKQLLEQADSGDPVAQAALEKAAQYKGIKLKELARRAKQEIKRLENFKEQRASEKHMLEDPDAWNDGSPFAGQGPSFDRWGWQ